jgi:hypothetical protein
MYWYFFRTPEGNCSPRTADNVRDRTVEKPAEEIWILKFLGNSQNDYQEEREIEEAVKNNSLGTRYY